MNRPVLTLALAATLATLATPALAQQARGDRAFSIRIPTGAFVPTGTRARLMNDASTNAVQLAWTLRPALAITGTFAWAHSRNLATVGPATNRLDVFTADLGLERRVASLCGECRTGFTAFTAAGAGARRYDQRGPGLDAITTFAAYAGAGGEFRHGRLGLRLEVRDYVSQAAALPSTTARGAQNDVVVLVGLRLIRAR